MRDVSRALVLAAVVAAVTPSGAAVAGDWELEVHAGGLFTWRPTGGRAARLPPGESFVTIVPDVWGRRVASWFFGDGGTLLRRDLISPVVVRGFTAQQSYTVGTLDSVLSSAVVGWPPAGVAGLRLGRRMGRRLTAEVDVEYGGHAPTFSKAARRGFEESRLAFESAWSDVFSSLPASVVTSRATVWEGSGRQLVATAVLNVNLTTGDVPEWSRRPPRRRFVSYLTLGAGIVSTQGEEASATLVGRYWFPFPFSESRASFEETDTVTVRSSDSFRTAFVGVVGVGWKQDLSARWGIRLDARAYLSRDPTRTVLDARPSVTAGTPTSALVVESPVGAVQFVNDPSGDREGNRSSLSAPAVTGFESYKGTGILMQINVTFGVFLRL